MIDLRSDTVTNPTDEMREAMATALVGDDVYEDDPTVKKLEALAAKMTGKAAAMFVPSGTMGNQLAIMTHTKRGDEVILGYNAHIVAHEVGAAAVISGVSYRKISAENDILTAELIKANIREEDIHYPDTGLIALENALGNGMVIPLDEMKKIYDVAQENQIPVHLDGARLFNAATFLGIDATEMTQYSDSVMFCLSKGLCAPAGSILAGSEAFIKRAKKNRKLLGGGMRQIGILAAAGIIALEKMTKRLHVDHDNAKYLGEKLAKFDFIDIDTSKININMVFFKINVTHDSAVFVKFMRDNGIKMNGPENGEYRLVTHNWITKEDIDTTTQLISKFYQ